MGLLHVSIFVALTEGVFTDWLTRRPYAIRPDFNLQVLRPPINSVVDWSQKDVVKVLSVTNGGKWGDWHEPAFCPRGSYAVAYRMKIEKNQLSGDDTALNAIRLKCWSRKEDTLTELMTEEGPWGDWYDWGYCPLSDGPGPFTLLTAFTLKVEPDQGIQDDTAANDVQFLCKSLDSWEVLDPTTSSKADHHGQGPFGSYGHWSSSCPFNSAICGLRIKIEREQGGGDDTALNDVQFYCCRLQEPSITLIGK